MFTGKKGGSTKLRGKAAEVRYFGHVLLRIWRMHMSQARSVHRKILKMLEASCEMETILENHRDAFALPGDIPSFLTCVASQRLIGKVPMLHTYSTPVCLQTSECPPGDHPYYSADSSLVEARTGSCPGDAAEKLFRTASDHYYTFWELREHFRLEVSDLFQLTQKGHSCMHMFKRSGHMNPRRVWCYKFEDFMGHMRILALASSHG